MVGQALRDPAPLVVAQPELGVLRESVVAREDERGVVKPEGPVTVEVHWGGGQSDRGGVRVSTGVNHSLLVAVERDGLGLCK